MSNWRNEIADLKKLVAELLAENATLKAENAVLNDKLNKTSRNSSKPPSSDIVKPKPDGKKSQRKIGAQPGHPQHLRGPNMKRVERPFRRCTTRSSATSPGTISRRTS
jgi:hypothetical protein